MSFNNQLQHSDSKRFQQSISRLHSSAFVFSGRAAHCVIYASYYYHHFLAVIVFHYILSHAGSSSLNRVLSLSLLLHALHPLSLLFLCAASVSFFYCTIYPPRDISSRKVLHSSLSGSRWNMYFLCVSYPPTTAREASKSKREPLAAWSRFARRLRQLMRARPPVYIVPI